MAIYDYSFEEGSVKLRVIRVGKGGLMVVEFMLLLMWLAFLMTSNELIQIKGYVFDDTDRKNAEEELILSKSQMKDILDSIQDGFSVLSRLWIFTYVNANAGEYFGMEPEESNWTKYLGNISRAFRHIL